MIFARLPIPISAISFSEKNSLQECQSLPHANILCYYGIVHKQPTVLGLRKGGFRLMDTKKMLLVYVIAGVAIFAAIVVYLLMTV